MGGFDGIRVGRRAVGLLHLLALLAVLGLAAYLRFEQLATHPGWYSDEGTLADIARHRNQGRVQYQALTESTLLVARFPIVPAIVAGLMPADGNPLLTLRAFTAALGVLSTAVVYAAVRSSARAGLGLLAAGLFAVYPAAVFYSRVGFSYNLLTPLVLVAYIGLWLYLERGSRAGAVGAALAVGLGSVTDLMMVSVLMAGVLAVLIHRWRDLGWWIPLSLAPLALYLLSIGARDPGVLITDARFILALMSAVPWWAQLPLLVVNLGTLMLTEVWWLPGLLGLLLLRPARARSLMLLLYLVPLLLLGRTAGLAGLRLYSISPLFPFVAIGVANLLWIGVPWMLSFSGQAIAGQLQRVAWLSQSGGGRWLATRLQVLAASVLVFLLALSPLLLSTLQLLGEVQRGFRRGDSWAYLPAGPASEAARQVNQWARPDELVLASPALAWALETQTADFQQVLAYSGVATIDYPAELPAARFAYDASSARASYAVIDPIWREWGAAHMPAVAELLRELEGWPVLWERAGITIHENPSR